MGWSGLLSYTTVSTQLTWVQIYQVGYSFPIDLVRRMVDPASTRNATPSPGSRIRSKLGTARPPFAVSPITKPAKPGRALRPSLRRCDA